MNPAPSPSGRTRSSRQPAYLLQTPDTFVRTPMPEIVGGVAIVHASPALGAEFVWLTLELEPGGTWNTSRHSRFFFLLDGTCEVRGPEGTSEMTAGDYGYAPPGMKRTIVARRALRCAVLVKRYSRLRGAAMPAAFSGRESSLASQSLGDCQDIEVLCLVPSDFAYDFAVNTMTYASGAALPQVEIHYMEHGLLMLSGSGTYRLGNDVHQVGPGDFIWMEAYCPQWFEADADGPAKYLIYKNFHRMPTL